jgi:HPt (histidine-containing phosphotransfer) domain-containing protein
MANGDHAGAEIIAHTIKGTAATLGADSLAVQAGMLEKAAREIQAGTFHGDDMRNEMEIISREFAALVAALPRTEPGAMT